MKLNEQIRTIFFRTVLDNFVDIFLIETHIFAVYFILKDTRVKFCINFISSDFCLNLRKKEEVN